VVGFYITSLAFGTYVGVRLLELARHQLAHAGNPARARLAA
jgi:hypothetical protein